MSKKTLSSKEIREKFLVYFQKHQHTVVPSSSLIPNNDPTLLFTNAGMVQFKDVFLGTDPRPYTRAVSSQRCVRAGGKHNDLERVGYTARHHTFFEMLGNFSFGDYFKKEAIEYAWDFLTKEMGLPPEKLWVSVYEEDQESEDIWLNTMKIDPKRFSRCGEEDNFWSMGATGPCGPCTEIFYDHGKGIPGGPPGSPDADGDRYIEIWNLVFMQYDRAADGTLTPLPKPSVDTGMGLERITAVMQGVHNNYDTDLFMPLIKEAAALSQQKDLSHFSLRVIADHIRSASFLITDGVMPSNEGRGYVLRRIIRRALRHGNKLGLTEPFFYKIVKPLVSVMGSAYPELVNAQKSIETTLKQEEEQFNTTLTQGLKLFDSVVDKLQGKTIPGETVFMLYDTYGFPADLTADIARERGLTIDEKGFIEAMQQQRDRSRQSSQFKADYAVAQTTQQPTKFTGHEDDDQVTIEDSQILAMYRDGKFVAELKKGDQASIVLDRTPFYAESGGQVGDQGEIRIGKDHLFKVHDTIKQGHIHLHLGKLERGTLRTNDTVTASIDAKRRAAIVLNHSATHLLHTVLHEVLGEHAIQKGSLVEAERLRFDFTHAKPLTDQERRLIEDKVNEHIRANHKASVEITSPEVAMASGALALFGEKYGSKVRVVSFGPSKELCGGTHASQSGNIGAFIITNESGIAAGVRRIEAVTGQGALAYLRKQEADFKKAIERAEEKGRLYEKEIASLKNQLASVFSQELATKAKRIGDVYVLATTVEGLDGKALRDTLDHLKQQLKRAVIVLATVKGNKVGLVGGVTDSLVAQISAKDVINGIATQVGGRGGGRADMAEAGGNQPENLEKALQSLYTWVEDKVTP